jgi:hypothetical protein
VAVPPEHGLAGEAKSVTFRRRHHPAPCNAGSVTLSNGSGRVYLLLPSGDHASGVGDLTTPSPPLLDPLSRPGDNAGGGCGGESFAGVVARATATLGRLVTPSSNAS